MPTYTCTECQASSDDNFGFVRKWKPAGRPTYICVTCREYGFHKRGRKDLTNLGIGVVLALFVLVMAPFVSDSFPVSRWMYAFRWLPFNLLLLYPLLHVAVAIHELGHALAARAVGIEILMLSFGRGRTVASGEYRGIYVVVSVVPAEGLTVIAPVEERFIRARLMLTYIAGPLINLAAAAVLIALFGESIREMSLVGDFAFLKLLVIANGTMGVLNLLPFKYGSSMGPVWSDGGQLVTLPFAKRDYLESLYLSSYVSRSHLAFIRNRLDDAIGLARVGLGVDPDNVMLKSLLGAALLNATRYDEGLQVMRAMAQAGSNTPFEHAMISNNIAHAIYMLGAWDQLAEADALSAEAYAAYPWCLPIKSTRGALLTELGRPRAAAEMLADPRFAIETAHNRANTAAALSIAHARLGNHGEAARALEEAEKLDPRCELLPRARAEVKPGRDTDLAGSPQPE